MPNYNFLKNILAEIESYKQERGDYPNSTQEFSYWLYSKLSLENISDDDVKNYGSLNLDFFGSNAKIVLSFLFTTMHRFKLNYTKLAVLENGPLETYDEVAFLLGLMFNGPMTHSQLIDMEIQNKPTGTEIIKRLLRKNVITQTPSQEDKRSKLLRVTPYGEELYEIYIRKVKDMTDSFFSYLSPKELIQLGELVKKLYLPHQYIFESEKKLNWQEIQEKYNLKEMRQLHTQNTESIKIENN